MRVLACLHTLMNVCTQSHAYLHALKIHAVRTHSGLSGPCSSATTQTKLYTIHLQEGQAGKSRMALYDSPVAAPLQKLLHKGNAAESFKIWEIQPRQPSRIVKI